MARNINQEIVEQEQKAAASSSRQKLTPKNGRHITPFDFMSDEQIAEFNKKAAEEKAQRAYEKMTRPDDVDRLKVRVIKNLCWEVWKDYDNDKISDLELMRMLRAAAQIEMEGNLPLANVIASGSILPVAKNARKAGTAMNKTIKEMANFAEGKR